MATVETLVGKVKKMPQKGKTKSASRTQEKNKSVLNRERKDAASRKRDGLPLLDNDGDLAAVDRSPTASPPFSSSERGEVTNEETSVFRRRPNRQERVAGRSKQTRREFDEGYDEDQIAADIAAEEEEFDRQNDDLDPDQMESKRKAEETRLAQEEADRKAEETRLAEEEARRRDEEEIKNELRQDIMGKSLGDWNVLSAEKQNQIIEDAYQSTFTEEARKTELIGVKRRAKRSKKTDVELEKEVTVILRGKAAAKAAPEVTRLAEQAKAATRNLQLAQDKDSLRYYINNSLNDPEDTVEVKEILLAAVDQLSFSNYAFGSMIKQHYSEAHIQQAAYRWNGMNNRVNGLQIVTNMHVPGGSNTPLSWKDRGENWEKTKNLVAKAGNTPNNVHLHTDGDWQRSKKLYRTRPTD